MIKQNRHIKLKTFLKNNFKDKEFSFPIYTNKKRFQIIKKF